MYKNILLLIIIFICSFNYFAQAALTTPGQVSPKNTTENVTVTLKASAVTNARLYEFQLDTSANFNSPVLVTGMPASGANTLTVKYLYFNQKYYWRVRAFALNKSDSSAWSSAATFTTAGNVTFALPRDKSTDFYPGTTIWPKSIGAKFYDIQIDTTELFNSPELKFLTENDSLLIMRIYNLLIGQTYHWRARARTDIDTTEWSEPWTFTTRAVPNINSPANITVADASTVLSWTMGPNGFKDSVYYEVMLDTTEDFSSAALQHNIVYKDESLKTYLYLGKKHYWKVRAYNKRDTSDWSPTASFNNSVNIKLFGPKKSTKLAGLFTGLSWDNIEVPEYQLEVDTTASFNSAAKMEYTVPSTNWNFQTTEITVPYFNTQYFWRVRAVTPIDTVDWSEVFDFYTAGTIKLIAPAKNTINLDPVVTLRWDSLERAASYDYELDTSADFNSPALLSGNIAKVRGIWVQVTVQDLYFGTKYFWRVRARSSASASEWSTSNFTTKDTIEQIFPADGFYSALKATLLWDDIDGELGYQYQLSEDSLFTGAALKTSKKDSALANWPTRLKPFTRYFWRVRAFHSKDTSVWSTTYFTSTLDKPKIISPALNAVNVPLRNVVLDWEDVPNADFYILERSQYSDLSNKKKDTVYVSQFTVPSLPQNAPYYWQVTAVKKVEDDGSFKVYVEGEGSGIYKFTTGSGLPLVPKLISPANLSRNISLNPTLSWQNDSMATKYEVAYSLDFYFNSGVTTKSVTVNSIQIGPLIENKTYYWRVRAVNTYGTTQWSSAYQFTTVAGTGIVENPELIGIIIYPNPAKKYFSVNLDESTVIQNLGIIDLQGRTVLSLSNIINEKQIDIQGIKPGLYLVQISTNKGVLIRKLKIE